MSSNLKLSKALISSKLTVRHPIVLKNSIGRSVLSTSINESTLDEAPMAYKSLSDIIDVIDETVDVIEVLKPIYNFKASY